MPSQMCVQGGGEYFTISLMFTDEETEEEKEKKRLIVKAREEFFAAIKLEGETSAIAHLMHSNTVYRI